MINRKYIYLVIAVIVAMCAIFIQTCRTKCPPTVDVGYMLDSLQYSHEVNVCRFEQVVSKRDTIVKTLNRIQIVEKKISDIKPVYSPDSLTNKILEIINTDQNNLEL